MENKSHPKSKRQVGPLRFALIAEIEAGKVDAEFYAEVQGAIAASNIVQIAV